MMTWRVSIKDVGSLNDICTVYTTLSLKHLTCKMFYIKRVFIKLFKTFAIMTVNQFLCFKQTNVLTYW